MRCSLLTLSTYLDGELAPDRAGELEAHLVACRRCSDGLGYLREEQQHIRALASVTVARGAASELLSTVGLMTPAPVQVAPEPAPQFLFDLSDSHRPVETGEHGDLELNGSPSSKTAPQEPEPEPEPIAAAAEVAAESVETAPSAPAAEADAVAAADDEAVLADEPSGSMPVAAPGPPAPAQWSSSTPAFERAAPPSMPAPRFEPAERTPMPAAFEPAATPMDAPAPAPMDAPEPEPAEAVGPPSQPPRAAHAAADAPPAPPPVGPLQTGRGTSWFDRARDAIALRVTLMRGSQPARDDDIDDDSIQIVSGAGAPPRRRWPEDRPMLGTAPPAAPSMDPFDEPDGSFEMPEFSSVDRPATEYTWPGSEALAEPEHTTSEPIAPEYVAAERVAPETARNGSDRAQATPDGSAPAHAAEAPAGRHLRALRGERRSFKMPSLSMPKLGGAGRRITVASPLADRRLWIFGSAVTVLALLGLLLGKHTTTVPQPGLTHGAVPNPTAIALPSIPAQASLAPTAAATAQPTPQATKPSAAATPAPQAGPNPAQLTGAQNLGAGGTGFSVQEVRYGSHPGDFRIVFDLSGSGSPTTTVGFGSPTTLYVEFTGVTGNASVAQPSAGQTATAVRLLQPSPIAGKTVYEITLSKPATLTTSYLQGPVRLVIDLG